MQDDTATQTEQPAPVVYRDPFHQGETVLRVVEDFETDSLSSYTGDVDAFSIREDWPEEGKQSLEASVAHGEQKQIIAPDFADAPSIGERFKFDYYLGNDRGANGKDVTFLFGVESESDYYAVRYNAGIGDISLSFERAGKTISSTSIELGQGLVGWNTIDVDWRDDGPSSAWVYPSPLTDEFVPRVTAELRGIREGGIGWAASNGDEEPRWFDQLRVVKDLEPDETETSTPLQ